MYRCINNKIYIGDKVLGVFDNLVEGKEYEIEEEKIIKKPAKVTKKGEIKKYEEVEMVKIKGGPRFEKSRFSMF